MLGVFLQHGTLDIRFLQEVGYLGVWIHSPDLLPFTKVFESRFVDFVEN